MIIHTKDNAQQVQAFAATSTAAVAFDAKPGELTLLDTDADCYVVIGTSAVAAASATNRTIYLSSQTPMMLRLQTGDTHFRVIQDTAAGNLGILRLQEDSAQG